jgi:hypothetical protein
MILMEYMVALQKRRSRRNTKRPKNQYKDYFGSLQNNQSVEIFYRR